MRHGYRTNTYETVTPLQHTFGKVWRGLSDRTPGGTVKVDGGPAPTTGYMVGGVTPELVVDMESGDAHTRYGKVVDWVRNAVAEFPDANVGWWRDDATGFYHLDVSENWVDLVPATVAAVARGEIAIWDLANSEEIRVNGS